MKIVIFGLSVSSAWGNGHATLWRGLFKALSARHHQIVFFERNTEYYATHRDYFEIAGGKLIFYDAWSEITARAKTELDDAEVGMVTSYCPDGIAATRMLFDSQCEIKTFYDLDTPVTLDRLKEGLEVDYVDRELFPQLDLVLSYTGGKALVELSSLLGARNVSPLYGSVDPEVHHPVPASPQFRADLSYLGTYAQDRQQSLERFLFRAAERLTGNTFLIGGAQYPALAAPSNVRFIPHIPPGEHSAFYCSSPLTLNITRRAMADYGFCPSGRLFEAAACGTAVISDNWAGLDHFYQPEREILICHDEQDVLRAVQQSPYELLRTGRLARERTLDCHTASRRASELEKLLDEELSSTLSAKGANPCGA